MRKYEELYLLIPLNKYLSEIESITGNESYTLHKYLFITNSSLYQNGSYFHTKTSSWFLIVTPENISPTIKETHSLS